MWLFLQLNNTSTAAAVTFRLNGDTVSVEDDHGTSLLDALREQVGCHSVKDGCSPQGQCGCCTVWVDGAPRVACVTAVRRVAGRSITTVEGLDPELRNRWARAFADAGASQCGFCTPGILLRLASLEQGNRPVTRQAVESALLAHLCRCTGWQSIVEAACAVLGLDRDDPGRPRQPATGEPAGVSDPLLASWRAQIEGTTSQSSGPDVVLGGGGFADDSAPAGALVQLGEAADQAGRQSGRGPGGRGEGAGSQQHGAARPPRGGSRRGVGADLADDLGGAGVPGARCQLVPARWHAGIPAGQRRCLRGKAAQPRRGAGRSVLATEWQRPVRVLWSREDVVRYGPKRPPLALGLRPDGSGVVRIGRTPGSAHLGALEDRLRQVAPGVVLEEVDIAGPPVALDLRGAVWVEVLAALHALRRAPGRGWEERAPVPPT